MKVHEMQEEILRLKKEKDVCILAHAYQSQEILETADFTGDSYGLSLQAAKAPQKNLLLCGVRFMAETCKILNPEKRVWLANPLAGCPMAEQMTPEILRGLKKQYPGYTVAAYVNTTAELKAECDLCVTSSSALLLCSNTVSPFCLQEIFISMLQCNITFALSQFPSEKKLLVDCNRTGFAIQ